MGSDVGLHSLDFSFPAFGLGFAQSRHRVQRSVSFVLQRAGPATLTLYRHDPPLALTRETAARVAVARGNMRFGVRTGGVDHPIYVVGTVVRDSIYRFAQEGKPCFFASTELVRELLELGVRNFSFRPVRLVDRAADPCSSTERTG